LTLANSDWTGERIRECHGIEAVTLYPPVTGIFPDVPWEDRSDGFVCIGRISPEKELDRVIDILAAARAASREIALHIVGTPDDPAYTARIRRRVLENSSWVHLHENVSREELARVVSQNRYGIHGMAEEHFGMGIAEMIHAGSIVFVPRGGGQKEIVA